MMNKTIDLLICECLFKKKTVICYLDTSVNGLL